MLYSTRSFNFKLFQIMSLKLDGGGEGRPQTHASINAHYAFYVQSRFLIEIIIRFYYNTQSFHSLNI